MSLTFDASGGKWFGTANHKVSYFDDNGTPTNKADDTWTSFTKLDGLVDMPIVAIAIDAVGGKWFASAEGARYLDDNGTPTNKSDDVWVTFTETDGLGCDNIWDIVIDTSGGIWVGGKCGGISGLSYLDDNGTHKNKLDDSWTVFTGTDEVGEIAIDLAGAKWLIRNSSAGCFNDNGTPADQSDDTWTGYRYIDGLECALGSGRAVAVDSSGGKWFGGGGISYCP
jgi:hypothetical protein